MMRLPILHHSAQVRQIPGKVLFSSSAEINSVCKLKAAERLFLLLKLSTPEPPPTQANKGRGRSRYNVCHIYSKHSQDAEWYLCLIQTALGI